MPPLAYKLRLTRELAGLSQRQASQMSGVGVKTLSSFETGSRIDSIKVSQLRRLLAAYGVSMARFFAGENQNGE